MHYKNGREAKVGDQVIGTAYNTKDGDKSKIIAGTLLSVTPGPDSCSALVGFLVTDAPVAQFHHDTVVRIQGDTNHGNAGNLTATYFKADYTDCHSLLHAEDAWPKD